MLVKVYVVDFQIPQAVKKWALKIGIPVAVLVGGGVAFAGLPGGYADGQSLTAEVLSSNFNYLQQEITTLVPPGTIEAYGGIIDGNPGGMVDGGAPLHPPPAGWLLCNGDQLNGLTPAYAALYAAIGTSFGGTSTSQSFNLPDLRGTFLRGVDNGAGRDPDRSSRTALAAGGNTGDTVGSSESAAFASHAHPITDKSHTHGVSNSNGSYYSVCAPQSGPSAVGSGGNGAIGCGNMAAAFTGITTTESLGGSETRPLNVNVNYIIKM
jgi:microcystin-dependent protein